MQLEELAQSYIEFLISIGHDIEALDNQQVGIFADNCKKIINKEVTCQNKQELINQLKSIRAPSGRWDIIVNEIIPSLEANCTVVQYEIMSENFGKFIVISILKYKNSLITEINEVFHHLEK